MKLTGGAKKMTKGKLKNSNAMVVQVKSIIVDDATMRNATIAMREIQAANSEDITTDMILQSMGISELQRMKEETVHGKKHTDLKLFSLYTFTTRYAYLKAATDMIEHAEKRFSAIIYDCFTRTYETTHDLIFAIDVMIKVKAI